MKPVQEEQWEEGDDFGVRIGGAIVSEVLEMANLEFASEVERIREEVSKAC